MIKTTTSPYCKTFVVDVLQKYLVTAQTVNRREAVSEVREVLTRKDCWTVNKKCHLSVLGHVQGGMKHETTINFTLNLHHFFTSLQFSLAMQKEHNPLLAWSDMHQLHKRIFSLVLSFLTSPLM